MQVGKLLECSARIGIERIRAYFFCSLVLICSAAPSWAQTAVPPFRSTNVGSSWTQEGSTHDDVQRRSKLPQVLAPSTPPTMAAGFMTTEESRDALSRDPTSGRQLDYLQWLPEGLAQLPGTALGYAFAREMPRPGDALVEPAYGAAVNPFDFWMLTSGDDMHGRKQAFSGKLRARYRDFKHRASEESREVSYGR